MGGTDVDSDGSISSEEFLESLDSKEMAMYFEALDVDIDEAEAIFNLIDTDGSGAVDLREFVDGCFRLHGPMKSIQFASFIRDFDLLIHKILLESQQTHACLQEILSGSCDRPELERKQPNAWFLQTQQTLAFSL